MRDKNRCKGAVKACKTRKCKGIYVCCIEKKGLEFCYECNSYLCSGYQKFADQVNRRSIKTMRTKRKEVIKMKTKTYVVLLLLFGISNHILASNSISKSLVGHWFVVEKNYNYSSEESVNYEEEVIYNFIFNDDGTGFWMIEREKKHSSGEPEKNEQKFNYKWKVQDDKIVFDFYEMGRTFESSYEFSDSVLTLSDPEQNTRKYSKKEV